MSATVMSMPDFAPQWQRPEDESAFWFRDVMHNPAPITPLNASFLQPAFSRGASRAIDRLCLPITGLQISVHHGYVYICGVPFQGWNQIVDGCSAVRPRLT